MTGPSAMDLSECVVEIQSLIAQAAFAAAAPKEKSAELKRLFGAIRVSAILGEALAAGEEKP